MIYMCCNALYCLLYVLSITVYDIIGSTPSCILSVLFVIVIAITNCNLNICMLYMLYVVVGATTPPH